MRTDGARLPVVQFVRVDGSKSNCHANSRKYAPVREMFGSAMSAHHENDSLSAVRSSDPLHATLYLPLQILSLSPHTVIFIRCTHVFQLLNVLFL